MSYYPTPPDVDETIRDIAVEASPIDNLFDGIFKLFYNIFPGLKTNAIEQGLTIMELTEDEGFIEDVGITTAKKKLTAKRIAEAQKETDDAQDFFNALSRPD